MEREFERDTSPEARRIMIAGLRTMTPQQKLARVVSLNRSVETLARTGVRLRNPHASDEEIRQQVARMWLDEPTLQAVLAKIASLRQRS